MPKGEVVPEAVMVPGAGVPDTGVALVELPGTVLFAGPGLADNMEGGTKAGMLAGAEASEGDGDLRKGWAFLNPDTIRLEPTTIRVSRPSTSSR